MRPVATQSHRVAFSFRKALNVYVVYLDESGNPGGFRNSQNHFVIGGIAVHESLIRSLSDGLDEIQAEFFPKIALPFKFHANEIRGRKGRFREMSHETRAQLLDAVYGVMTNAAHPQLLLFATAIHVTAVTSAEQALTDTFEDIARRVNAFLTGLRHSGNPQNALLVIDRSSETESKYRALVAEFRASETDIENIVDIPYFSHSSETRLLQLADFIAYAVFRYYEHGDGDFLDKIALGFNSNRRYFGDDGLAHIIAASESCGCLACGANGLNA